jgi:Straboviridae single-stranded DNA-binding protein
MKTMNFAQLVENAQKTVEKNAIGGKKEYKIDEKYFTVKVDAKTGTMPATIRFISPKEDDSTFYEMIWHHSFEVNGKKFYVTCPTTFQDKEIKCPVCIYNKEHWKEYTEKEQSDRKRKLKYISNIYVVSDPGNPARDGKVFLWAYGSTIHKKIMNIIAPPKVEGMKPKKSYNIFDEKTGKDFEMLVGLKNGNNNYDNCNFSDEGSELCDGDEAKLKAVRESTFSLKEALKTETDKIKSYAEIEKWLMTTLTGKRPSESAPKQEFQVADKELWNNEDTQKQKEPATAKLNLKEDMKEETKPATTEEDFFNFEV